jgi:hypothetical protein
MRLKTNGSFKIGHETPKEWRENEIKVMELNDLKNKIL